MLDNPKIIFAIDDEPDILLFLVAILEDSYHVQIFQRGDHALEAMTKNPPDLILLDIDMPAMNGFEVCRRIKADETLRQIPVIVITSFDGIADKVKAFKAGCVDYITKPFQKAEVRARVQTHLNLQQLHRDLTEKIAALEEAERCRDNLTQMIVHDMRGPLSGMLVLMKLIKNQALGQALDPIGRDLDLCIRGGTELMQMINDLLDIGRIEAGRMPLSLEQWDLMELIRQAVSSVAIGFPEEAVLIEGPETILLPCDATLVRRIVENLAANGLKYNQADKPLRIAVCPEENQIRIRVSDRGPGIAPEHHEKIFEKFGVVQSEKAASFPSTGLGLAFCRLAVETLGGRIGIQSGTNEGSVFWFTLPLPL